MIGQLAPIAKQLIHDILNLLIERAVIGIRT